MTSKTVLLCVSIILFFIMVEHLRYLPRNVVIKKYFRSEFRGRQLMNRKLFADYLRRFNKLYEPEEFRKRFRHFKNSLKEIERLNDGSNQATFGVTKFSDWSPEERSRMLAPALGGACSSQAMNCTDSSTEVVRESSIHSQDRNSLVPPKWDWRKEKKVSPIFDQNHCQICWAVSTAGVMESMAAIHGLGLTTLSKQQLMDCSFDPGMHKTGCRDGRALIDVFENLCRYHMQVATEAQYPTTFAEEDCRSVRGQRRLKSFDNNCAMKEDEEKLVEVLTRGPVTALVNAHLFFNYYEGIISYHCEATENDLNHAVQIVGYDKTTVPPHYIVKNSWGEDWGEDGYVRLAIGSNQCGIAFSIGILDVV